MINIYLSPNIIIIIIIILQQNNIVLIYIRIKSHNKLIDDSFHKNKI